MRKLVVLAFLAAVVAAIAATSAAAKPPGTNGLISFTRFDPALHQDVVYTINPDGSDVRRVTSGADDDYPGDYSPNGKRIVFLRSSFDSGLAALYTVKLDGSDLRQITPTSRLLDFTGGSWSPQGNDILFSASPSESQR